MDALRAIATQLVGGTAHVAAWTILGLVLLAMLVVGEHDEDDSAPADRAAG